MNQAAETLDGWYCLHEFRSINWPEWKKLSERERNRVLDEFYDLLEQSEQVMNNKEGSHAFYSVAGQKADL